ncbi:MAG: HAD-IIB family hydrolase [Halioglobus sp.]|nr:HAD-IIB family hydrolase [Halioglobus sp.]
MRILATDLDRTLLPNGQWPADEGAIALFNALTQKHGILLVYVTGRNLALTEQAIARYGVRYPEVLCADVGTSMWRRERGRWRADARWAAHIQRINPAWDAAGVDARLSAMRGLRAQGAAHQGPFKQSYYVDPARGEAIVAQVRQRLGGAFDETLVYSVDGEAGRGLLDCLPRAANKRTALEYIADEAGVAYRDLVFCGDSGNDIEPLTGPFSGVAVRNADPQLRQSLARAAAGDHAPRVYFARGGCRGLNGYYVSGVIEGCYHYGLFNGRNLDGV